MSKEFQIKDGDLIASFDLENEGGDIDFCDLFKISNGVANKIGTFIDYDVTNKIIGEQSKQISDLQLQLAEKEKENEQLKKFDDLNKTFFDLFRTAFKNPYKVDDLFNTLKTMQEKQVQDKISFALEQLEQIRKEFEIKFKGCKWEDKMLVGKFCNITNETIDNQINVLRNNKDGIHKKRNL